MTAENYHLNEYPDEEDETSEDELTSRSSDEEEEEDSEDNENSSSRSQSRKMVSGGLLFNKEDSGMDEWSDYAEDDEEQY